MASKKHHVAIWKSGSSVRWRGLSMKEYQEFSHRLTYEPEMIVYSDLYRLVAGFSDNVSVHQATAGVVFFLGNKLLRESAFDGNIDKIKNILSIHRERLNTDYYEQCKAVLASIFRYTYEEIEEWDESTFFDRLAKAELISQENFDPHLSENSNPKTQSPNAKRPKKPLTEVQKMILERRSK